MTSTSAGPNPPGALLQLVVDNLSAMVAYWDADQRCRFANRAYEKWFGVDPKALIGREMRDFLGPLYDLNRPYIEGVLRGEPQEFERDIPNPNGGPPRRSLAQYIPDLADGRVRGFCVLVTDVTRLKQAEEALLRVERQLQDSERLAALGGLAAGIAHEINNPLAVVVANVELAQRELEASWPLQRALSEMLGDAHAAAKHIGQLMEAVALLARSDSTQPELVDVNEMLNRSIDFASTSLRYRARLTRDFADVGSVWGSAAQLVQIFVNLINNAAHSCTSAQPGEIRVSSRLDGATVTIEIADNGCGLPSEVRARVMNPFFTATDEDGVVLGLSISAAIVKGVGGDISVADRENGDNVFRVTFPAAEQEKARSDPAVVAAGGDVRPVGLRPRPRVLVIDDEPAVAKTLARMLAKSCEVVVCTHSPRALQLLLGDDEPPFALIFCDLMMPELGGEALYYRVASARPDVAQRFVLMTGGAFTPDGRRFMQGAPVPMLDKPFDLKRLSEILAPYVSGGV
jgi:PAS domain S-box-containing protein